ncbi:MAG: hypothetical protein P4M00_07480 [Azospirillaceae bacterium]|nr:hypothetical protein [Azospirillaceae bacterium]
MITIADTQESGDILAENRGFVPVLPISSHHDALQLIVSIPCEAHAMPASRDAAIATL